MSYSEMARLELINAINCISSETELKEFKDLLANYFAQKAQKEIDALWDQGRINEETIKHGLFQGIALRNFKRLHII